jgi:hypothetical protein
MAAAMLVVFFIATITEYENSRRVFVEKKLSGGATVRPE